MRPVAERDAEPGTQWTLRPHDAQSRTKLAELPLEVGLHIQKLNSKHVGTERDELRTVEADRHSLAHERISGACSATPHRGFKDVVARLRHHSHVGIRYCADITSNASDALREGVQAAAAPVPREGVTRHVAI